MTNKPTKCGECQFRKSSAWGFCCKHPALDHILDSNKKVDYLRKPLNCPLDK